MLELNKIYCMDCLEGMKEMDDESVDLVVTDPPYNTGMKAGKKGRLRGFFNDNLPKEEYSRLVEDCSKQIFRVLKNDSGGYVFINYRSLGLWVSKLEEAWFRVKNVIVWDKIVHGLNYQNYAHTHEFIIFFVKGGFFPSNKGKFHKDIWL